MFSKNKIDWNLLAKSLADETNEKEELTLSGWLEKSPENRTLYKKIKSDWKIIDMTNTKFNVDDAWDKLHGRINANEGEARIEQNNDKNNIRKLLYYAPMRIAASLLLIAFLGASAVYITGRLSNVSINVADDAKTKSIILRDGSKVILNSGTQLSYSKRFGRKTREVTLKGEAFFEVSPDKANPFLIHTENAGIRVVGTSFNVDTRNMEQGVEVYVSTGIVELFEKNNLNNNIVLKSGYTGTLKLNVVSGRKSENENAIAWKTGIMNFEDTQLSEVIEVINDLYKVNIICLEPGIDTAHTHGIFSYPDESLDKILSVICKQFTLKVEKSDNRIYLSR